MKILHKIFAFCSVFLLARITFLVSEKLLSPSRPSLPLIINTWQFKEANEVAWSVLNSKKEPLTALVEGLTICERLQCDGTVGFGGSPDEKGGIALDAMIMDGKNQNMGAVAGMTEIKDAAKVARHVLENTEHSLLVGEAATDFAEMMGFKRESLATKDSLTKWFLWFGNSCQPNFWKNVIPNPKLFCGPYKPLPKDVSNGEELGTKVDPNHRDFYKFGEKNHDTIGMIVVDKKGQIYAGTSTNGAIHKIPGRVGDSPVPGAGAYADNDVGAAVATGDGDIMMRFAPSVLAVEYLRRGFTPDQAAESVIKRILTKYPLLSGAVIVIDKLGNYGSACAGMKQFPYSIVSGNPRQTSRIKYKDCLTSSLAKNIKSLTKENTSGKNVLTNCHENQLKILAEIEDLKTKLQEKESAGKVYAIECSDEKGDL